MWRPIETAPRDGTAIWLLVDGDPSIGYYDPPDPPVRRNGKWYAKASCRRSADKPRVPDEIFGTYNFNLEPTHWMPLPEPPAMLTPSPKQVELT